ncbi:MAG TPA: diguanylate cyclase, partial [Symbiobacteriaceae bacterium]|nr:diguanylate cyclase [Symbiobacteriaceae bacterium]
MPVKKGLMSPVWHRWSLVTVGVLILLHAGLLLSTLTSMVQIGRGADVETEHVAMDMAAHQAVRNRIDEALTVPKRYLITGDPTSGEQFQVATARAEEAFDHLLEAHSTRQDQFLLWQARSGLELAFDHGWKIIRQPYPLPEEIKFEGVLAMEDYKGKVIGLLNLVEESERKDTIALMRQTMHRRQESQGLMVTIYGVLLVATVAIAVWLAHTHVALVQLAERDTLTGLYNRARFRVELSNLLRPGNRGALLFVDLDHFKYVNDSLGHGAGDQILQGLAQVLTRHCGSGRKIARIGGDEFGILLPGAGKDEAEAIARSIGQAIEQHVQVLNGQPVTLTASIGISLYPDHGKAEADLLAHADLAMYRVKAGGRNGVHLYAPDEDGGTWINDTLAWDRRIRNALAHDLFTLRLQPIFDLQHDKPIHYEVLLRMLGDDGALITPDRFLGV